MTASPAGVEDVAHAGADTQADGLRLAEPSSGSTPLSRTAPYDLDAVRADFPILAREVNGHPLVYLDSANTSHKPRQVLAAMDDFYTHSNANVARAVHQLGMEATEAFEGARERVARFIGAASSDEVVFTKNASEGYNLVAYAFGNAGTAMGTPASERFRLGPGDEVVVTEMEHHSNLVPWQLLCQRTGATLRWFGLTEDGRLDLSDLEGVVNERTKVVAFVHASNILGTVNPVETLVRRAHEVGALVLLDACQSVPHAPFDVQALGVDLAVFTGHKMVGPTGIGVVWGRRELLAAMPPFLGGGEMIEVVEMTGSTFKEPPHRFEAGTPPIAQAIGLGAACDYLDALGRDRIAAHEHGLVAYALEALGEVPGLRVIGPPTPHDRAGAISFALGDVHPHDVGQVLDSLGIAVRVGQHCARPVCTRYGVPATTRASFHLYSTYDEVDALVRGLDTVRRYFG